jgi:acetyl-CoA synthetase
VYGPLSNATTVLLYEGYMTYPTEDRWWQIIEQYKVTKFYTAPTAIRAFMRLGEAGPKQHDLSSLKILGTVGEPINPAAWEWYYTVIGGKRCPVVDTWWQTETGGVMIAGLPAVSGMKPGSAGQPLFGIAPQVLRHDGSAAAANESGSLVITKPWPSMIRGVYGDAKHELVKKVYFSDFPGMYFTGDGCRIDDAGYYWITGRIDDVINVSGHRLSTAEIESALVAHSTVAEAAVVGYPCDIRGQAIYCFVTVRQGIEVNPALRAALKQQIRTQIGPIATPDKIQFAPALPKTRSGKIMRRILRKIAEREFEHIGDTSTLAEPDVVTALIAGSTKACDI